MLTCINNLHLYIHVRCQVSQRESAMVEEFETNSCICKYDIYWNHWLPDIENWLECRKNWEPKRWLCCSHMQSMCHFHNVLNINFITHIGAIYFIVLGGWKYFRDFLKDRMQLSQRRNVNHKNASCTVYLHRNLPFLKKQKVIFVNVSHLLIYLQNPQNFSASNDMQFMVYLL